MKVAANQSYQQIFQKYYLGMQNAIYYNPSTPTNKQYLSTEIYDFLMNMRGQVIKDLPDDTDMTLDEALEQIAKMIKMKAFL